jgi:molecular chaperone GrpE
MIEGEKSSGDDNQEIVNGEESYPQVEDEVSDAHSQLAEQLSEAIREIDQFKLIAQRAQADLMNYRKRATDEIEETRRNANTGLLLKVLSVIDDFERAMALIPDDAVAPGWLEGLQLVHKGMQTMLEAEGVKRIDTVGRKFDPRDTEALIYEDSDSAAEDEVIRVIREGYMQRDRVLRPAQVVVAKQANQHSDESEGENNA